MTTNNEHTSPASTAPERIFLVVGDETPADANFADLAEIAWSDSRESDRDIEYVRAALAAAPGARQQQDAQPCRVCAESEPHTGACGSSDPRALCNLVDRAVPDAQPVADEREAFECKFAHLHQHNGLAEGCAAYTDPKTQGAWEGWQARAALAAPQPAAQPQPSGNAGEVQAAIMAKVQEFASTWATVDGRFDDGTAMERAEACKTKIDGMLRAALAAQPSGQAQPIPLAADHTGMMVDHSGVIRQAKDALEHGMRNPAIGVMLEGMGRHMEELGRRWYAGDMSAVDEFLQLYCVADQQRAALKDACAQQDGGAA